MCKKVQIIVDSFRQNGQLKDISKFQVGKKMEREYMMKTFFSNNEEYDWWDF